VKRLAAALLICLGAAAARAQEASPPAPSPTPSTSKPNVELTAADPVDIPGPMPIAPEGIAGAPVVRPRKAGEKKGLDFIAAPIPISNPTLGTGLAGVAAILFPISSKDDISPPATVGVGGFFTDNHSWAVAAAAKLYLAEDHWRVLGGVAKGEADTVASDDATPGELPGVARDQRGRGRVAERCLSFDKSRVIRPCCCMIE